MATLGELWQFDSWSFGKTGVCPQELGGRLGRTILCRLETVLSEWETEPTSGPSEGSLEQGNDDYEIPDVRHDSPTEGDRIIDAPPEREAFRGSICTERPSHRPSEGKTVEDQER